MADHNREIFNFVAKFLDLRQSGLDANLSLNCIAGKLKIQLDLEIGQAHPPAPRPQRCPGPSRLRRRARRAQVREEAAANAASSETIQRAVKAVPTNDAAVQAGPVTHTVDAAVQAANETKDVAVQAVPPQRPAHPLLQHQPAANAAGPQLQHAHNHPHQAVQDMFCPDEEYRQNRGNVRNTLQMIEDALNFSR